MNERQKAVNGTAKIVNDELLISELLTGIGVCPSYRGYHCLVHVIYLAASDGEYPFIVTKKLYADTAVCFGISPDSVQHSIRTLLDSFWSQKDSKKHFYDIIRYPVQDPLSPKEFIAVIADYIRRHRKS